MMTYDFLQYVIIAQDKQAVLDGLQITPKPFITTVTHLTFSHV